MRKLTTQSLVATALALGMSVVALADGSGNNCTLKTLRGSYVFAASGYNLIAGVPQPKAIIEAITFNGDGTLSSPASTRSVNGTVTQNTTLVTGSYTVTGSCSGTIVFDSGPSFDTFVSPKGDTVWMIQTNPNTVFQGTATRVPSESD
jgi:hypothetical protein